MRQILKVIGFGAACLLITTANRPFEKAKPFAVVELFTAEGCSSCPDADELLKEMTGILRAEGKEVLSLAFHVTYWNHLGWEDPYSNEIFTQRQKNYIESLKFEQLYTPQAIVNGQKEFIGSNPIGFRNEVTAALATMPSYAIQAQARKVGDLLVVNYELNADPKRIEMNIAVVEKEITHQVLRGENKNRTLKHYHVVKSLNVITPVIKGEAVTHWPPGLAPEKASLILYLQNTKSLKIVGATQLTIN